MLLPLSGAAPDEGGAAVGTAGRPSAALRSTSIVPPATHSVAPLRAHCDRLDVRSVPTVPSDSSTRAGFPQWDGHCAGFLHRGNRDAADSLSGADRHRAGRSCTDSVLGRVHSVVPTRMGSSK